MALSVTVGFLVLFGAFSLLAEAALRDSADRVLEERLAVARLTAGRLDDVLADVTADLSSATAAMAEGGQVVVGEAGPPVAHAPDALEDFFGRSHDIVTAVALVSPAGESVWTYPQGVGVDLGALAADPAVPRATGGEPGMSDLFVAPGARGPAAAVVVPISGTTLVAAAVLDLQNSGFHRFLAEAAAVGNTGHAVLFDGQGRAIDSTLGLPPLSPGEHVTFYRSALADGVAKVAAVPFELEMAEEPRGHKHIMAFAPLMAAPWGVAVGGDVDETFAGVARLRRGLAILGALSVLSVWVMTLVGARRLVRPVENLTAAAQRIAGGDVTTPLGASEGGEIGRMASALEQMRLQLLESIGALEDWNRTLERRVAVRTRELGLEKDRTRELLRRIMTAQEDERTRLSMELHDDVGQVLTAAQLAVERLRGRSGDSPETTRELDLIRSLTTQIAAALRRVISNLRPGVLDQLGLVPALSWVADTTLRPQGIVVTIDAAGLVGRLPRQVETTLFRIAQEAMSNVARHSSARQVDIELKGGDLGAVMVVRDDGRGFDQSAAAAGPLKAHGLGLAGMGERAALLGGTVDVKSAVGAGTIITVAIPIPEAVLETPSPGSTDV
ncbi:MAG: HAMP domain-containing protein [Anaerolineae bacterium]